MQILLIRHGASEDDFLEKGYKGSTDLQLTKRGLEQVEKMSSYISKEFPVLVQKPFDRDIEPTWIVQ
ncbi:histidine phosphatase family protein [Bacillus nitratireducens]|uniref:histidine phosphatase family protein n=1 Tax=Bacillus nitratireducens TaxID=2026193 RepID=UPI000A27E3B4|nr:histidine phosphatase family protein [Bacillus nitratireducens]OSX94465.1 hypothetical protein BTJ45_01822 [Bacillus mycoides]